MAYPSLKEALSDRERAVVRQSDFINRVFLWMFGGLAVSAVVAWSVAQRADGYLLRNPGVGMLLALLTIVFVVMLSAGIHRMSAPAATLCFVAYAALNGAMLSTLLLVYSLGSVMQAFCTTAIMFGATGMYGYLTKRDLASAGSFLFMALIGIIVASLVNLFLRSSGLELVISLCGVAVFVGLTAYDMQKIKKLSQAAFDGETAEKAAILGALTLYLDFINLFLYLLRFFGRRK